MECNPVYYPAFSLFMSDIYNYFMFYIYLNFLHNLSTYLVASMTTKLNANGTSLALSVPTGSSTTPAPDRDAIDPSLNDKNSSPLANHKVPESVETLSKGSLEPTVYPSKPLIIPATLTSPANSRVSKPKRDGKPNFRRGSATGKSGDPKDKRKPVVACIACRKRKSSALRTDQLAQTVSALISSASILLSETVAPGSGTWKCSIGDLTTWKSTSIAAPTQTIIPSLSKSTRNLGTLTRTRLDST